MTLKPRIAAGRQSAPTTLAGLVLAAWASLAPAVAQPQMTAAPVLSVGANETATSRKIDLTMGRSVVIDLPRDAKEVFVANPKVANAVVRSTRKVFLIGIENGATSIFIMDGEGRQITALDVTVAQNLNLGELQQILRQSIPGGRFDVRPAGGSIILSGSVNSASEAAQALDITNGFVGQSSGAGGGSVSKGAVINNLTIRNKDQVMLRVTVVEVARTVLKQFGVNLTGNWSGLNLSNVAPLALNGAAFPVGNGITGTIQGKGIVQADGKFLGNSIGATLKAFEQAGVSRVLAEPTLTAISGEAAKFTAGGQLPVPSNLSCTQGVGAQTCTPSIAFKPYGVSLSFTPVVLSENRISIRVATDVTEIDQQNSLNITLGSGDNAVNSAIPAFTVRSSETTIELASGATMMTAGLIQQRNKTAISGLPGLINLPIIGALFRSRDYQRQETELMIMVTPYIAKPMEARQAVRPDDGFVDAQDAQGILLGRVNRLYGAAGAAPLGNAYRGRVGFITD